MSNNDENRFLARSKTPIADSPTSPGGASNDAEVEFERMLRESIQFGTPSYEIRALAERIEALEQYGSDKQAERIAEAEEKVEALDAKVDFDTKEGLAEWVADQVTEALGEKVKAVVAFADRLEELEQRIEALEATTEADE